MARPRILVVDDQPHIARITRMMLEQAGKYDIAQETRSSQVLDTAREFSPDAIVLDLNMPGKDGRDIARELWKDDALHSTAILFFCGLVPPRDAALEDSARGPFRFVSKLIPSQDLISEIDEILLESKVSSST